MRTIFLLFCYQYTLHKTAYHGIVCNHEYTFYKYTRTTRKRPADKTVYEITYILGRLRQRQSYVRVHLRLLEQSDFLFRLFPFSFRRFGLSSKTTGKRVSHCWKTHSLAWRAIKKTIYTTLNRSPICTSVRCEETARSEAISYASNQ